MKSKFSVGLIALGVLGLMGVAHADVQSGSLSDIAQNVSGSATISSLLGNNSASFGPESGSSTAQALAQVSGTGQFGVDPRNNTPLTYNYDLQALSSASGDFHVSSSFVSNSRGTPTFASSAALNATVTWTGTLVNTTAQARSFSVLSEFRPFAGPDTNIEGIASLTFNGHAIASTADTILSYDLGTLAPGQKGVLSYTVVSSNPLNNLTAGSGLLLAPLLGYNATAVAAVPEPATTAMMVVGLGGVFWVRRRKTMARPGRSLG
jgi:PEP-CTERM motif